MEKKMLKLYSSQRRGKSSSERYDISFLNEKVAREIVNYHASFPIYEPTPLRDLQQQASRLGVKKVLVKDEAYRFGLNAFKVLGGSYAIGHVVADKLGEKMADMTFERLVSDRVREQIGEQTFVTATDGNHGRGVAWAANQLKQKSIVYMPFGSAQERAANIAKEGAHVEIKDGNYDEAVREANQLAEKHGYIMVQDTAWEGYEDIPRWIMQGYMTLAWEIAESLKKEDVKPTHIFLQAGVGSFAAAATGFFSNIWSGQDKPVISVVEPNTVACIFESAKADRRICIGGQYQTIMAGLACGEPNTVGLEVLLDYADHFISASDEFAAHGMRVLGAPIESDQRIIAGESGAAPFGVISKVMTDPAFEAERRVLGLDEHSVLLFINTEGATDQRHYESVVWDGACPSV